MNDVITRIIYKMYTENPKMDDPQPWEIWDYTYR